VELQGQGWAGWTGQGGGGSAVVYSCSILGKRIISLQSKERAWGCE
jgi:hypothetical protein